MDRRDHLCAVDALQIDGRDAEIAVPELALDHDQWHALTRQLDGMCVPKLVRCEPTPDTARTAVLRSSARAAALDKDRRRSDR